MQSVDSLRLERTPAGRLALTLADGSRHEGVTPVRAFPIAAPQEGLSLVGSDGHELLWIAQLSALPIEARQLIEQELAAREFTPVIEHIESVTSFSTPCTWTLRTDRGPAQLQLKGEEDIRRLSAELLIVNDAHGVQYLIRDLGAMDRASRKLLDRFL